MSGLLIVGKSSVISVAVPQLRWRLMSIKPAYCMLSAVNVPRDLGLGMLNSNIAPLPRRDMMALGDV